MYSQFWFIAHYYNGDCLNYSRFHSFKLMKRVLGVWLAMSTFVTLPASISSISKGVSACPHCAASLDIHIWLSRFHLPTNSAGICLLDQRFHKFRFHYAHNLFQLSFLINNPVTQSVIWCLAFSRLSPNENAWNALDMLRLQAAKFQNAQRAKVP